MPIRLGNSVIMSEDFEKEVQRIRDRVAAIYRAKIKGYRAVQQRDQAPWERRAFEAKLCACQQVLQRLREPAEEDLHQAVRGGLKYELLRLRRLPYVGYTVRYRRSSSGEPQTWLIAETGVIATQIVSRRGSNKPVWVGPYYVCVEAGSFGTSALSWHLLPKEDLRAPERHMHHVHHSYDEDGKVNPLDYDARTCWGEFNGIIQNIVMDGDVAGTFEILHQFAGSLNEASPLARIPVAVRYENPRTS